MNKLDFSIAIFVVAALGGTMVLRYSRFERRSHDISDPPKPWCEAIQGGSLLGAIFAVCYVVAVLADWPKLWN